MINLIDPSKPLTDFREATWEEALKVAVKVEPLH